MKLSLNMNKIGFRAGDGELSTTQQQEILAARLAGCNRVIRSGESLGGLENLLALRGAGPVEGIVAPLPRHPAEPYRIKSVELRGEGCPSPEARAKAIHEAG